MHAQSDAVNLSEAVTAALGNVLASNQWCVTDLLTAALLDRLGARPTSVGILVFDELDLTVMFYSLPVQLTPVPAAEANVGLIPAPHHLVSSTIRTHHVPVAPAPRIYADMLRPVVCASSEADDIRRGHIGF